MKRSFWQSRKDRRGYYYLHRRWCSIFAEHCKCDGSFWLWGSVLDYGLAQTEVEEASAPKRFYIHKAKRSERVRLQSESISTKPKDEKDQGCKEILYIDLAKRSEILRAQGDYLSIYLAKWSERARPLENFLFCCNCFRFLWFQFAVSSPLQEGDEIVLVIFLTF